MGKENELIKTVKEMLKGHDIDKIFWDKKIGKVIVMTKPKSGVDGMYIFENNLDRYRLFTPNEDFKTYHEIVQDNNLVYG